MNLDSSCQSSSYGNWIQLNCGEKGRGLLKERKRARRQRHKEKRCQNPQGVTVACFKIQKMQPRMSGKTSQVWKDLNCPRKCAHSDSEAKLKQLRKFTWGPGWLVVEQKELMNLAWQVCFNTLKEELTNRNDPHDRERGWRKRPFSALKHRNRMWLQSFPFIAHSDTERVVLDSCCLALMRCEGWVCTSRTPALCSRRQLGHTVTVLLIAKNPEWMSRA